MSTVKETNEPKKQVLKFQSFTSTTDVAFWQHFSTLKLNTFRLSDAPVSIIPIYEPSRSASIAARVSLRKGCFEADLPIKDSAGECACSGVFLNLNTREDFKNFNKNEWMGSLGSKLGKRILSGEAEADPSLLIPVAVLSFADLKKHRYMFWFTFPALVLSTPAVLDRTPQELSEVYSYPILRKMFGGLVAARKSAKKRGCPMFIWVPSADGKDGEVKQLGDFAALDDEAKNRVEVIVMDPCALPNHPGWPVRNLLVLAFAKWRLKRLRVICMRETIGVAEKVATYPQVGNLLTRGSMVLDVLAPPGEAVAPLGGKGVTWGATGWELNKDGKMGPRFVDLSSHLDPAKLAESACHLNLRLMRWRALPTLDTDMLGSTKCLLIGAGTLGCGVARSLLGWGVRDITFVDNGRVSYSNPVRQSLYNFADCADGGKFKATAAAAAIKAIYPGARTEGHVLTIPMPGHLVSSKQALAATAETIHTLEKLIAGHHVVMLLTDTRESRWLPSLLCAKYNKITLNAALGFDSYLVMRHGHSIPSDAVMARKRKSKNKHNGTKTKSVAANRAAEAEAAAVAPPVPPPVLSAEDRDESNRLGCYFCNDVVAPQNSTKDRTLDQQCTVTRPGLAPIASALLVELMVSILHHPKLNAAPAPAPAGSHTTQQQRQQSDAESNTCFGVVPHQLRGFLSSFSTVSVSGPAFPQCTACSPRILSQYEKEGLPMLFSIFNDPARLEQITGLQELQQQVEDKMMAFDDDDGDDF